jgi:hypothetical protein
MFKTKMEIVEYNIHRAETSIIECLEYLQDPEMIEPVLNEIRILKEKIRLITKAEALHR